MKPLAALPLLLLTAAGHPSASPAETIERQLTAYNAHDPDAFAATYAEDAQIFKAGGAVPVMQGRAAVRARYAALFKARPDIRAEVSGRLIAGDFVSDHESIVGSAVKAIVVYEVREGVIRRAWLFGSPPG